MSALRPPSLTGYQAAHKSINVIRLTRGMVSIPRSLASSGARFGCENGKVEGGSMGGDKVQPLFFLHSRLMENLSAAGN